MQDESNELTTDKFSNSTIYTIIKICKIIFSIISILIFFALIPIISGDWRWIEGWIFTAWFIIRYSTITVYLYYKDPALLAERSKPQTGGQKGWDKYACNMIMAGYFIWFIIMPLDAKRFAWSPAFPLWLKIIGGTELLMALFFMFRAVADNTFTSTVVRIQTERNQRVVSTGIYAFVRHPMYLAGMLMLTGAPLLLSSKYGFLTGIIIALIFAARIIGEEKMLTAELDGYSDYKKKVKYRLIPFIW